MAVRTTDPKVREIVSVDDGTSLAPFIEAAASLVDELVSTPQGANLDSERLELIERWLAAHFYLQLDPAYESLSVGKTRGKFQGRTGMVLSSTFHGQTAMALDTTGYLSRLSKRAEHGGAAVSLSWLGKEESS